jgi:putative ABC transport system substrate-binding protein
VKKKRRRLVAALGLSALTVPLSALAQQQAKVWRIGFLSPRSRPDSIETDLYGSFVRGMRDLGYVEGKNLLIEWRFADNSPSRLPGLAAELIRLKVDVIVTPGQASTAAAQKATTTHPVVMINAGDPLIGGFGASLARPGGNISGPTSLIEDYSPKQLQLLLDMLPKVSRVALLSNNFSSAVHATVLKNLQAAAQKVGVTIVPVEARSAQDLEKAFAVMIHESTGAVIVAQNPLFLQIRRQIADLAAKNRLPSIAAYREYVEVGILMSYGHDNTENYRRAASYVDKILKGAKPAELPVEQPTKFELVINLKTAKALGITIPNSILVQATKVIE